MIIPSLNDLLAAVIVWWLGGVIFGFTAVLAWIAFLKARIFIRERKAKRLLKPRITLFL